MTRDGIPAVAHEVRARLTPHLGAPAEARALVADALRRWRRSDVLDDALLVTSELVTNAVLHAPHRDIGLTVRLTPRAVRLEVDDASPDAPARRRSTMQDTTGRGLALVEAVAAAWGVDPHDPGKLVWAEVSRRS